MNEQTPLWIIHFTDGTAISNLDSAVISDTATATIWENSSLRITATRQCQDSLTYWGLSLSSVNNIDSLEYPILPLEGTPSKMYFPWQMGVMIPNPLDLLKNDPIHERWCWMGDERKHGQIATDYPGMASMQFIVFEYPDQTDSFYFGIHDGEAFHKGFGLYADATLRVRHYPDGNQSQWELPYQVVTGRIAGNWEQAAAFYRAWALKQEWCAQGKVSQRADIPQWVKDSDWWFWNWTDWENYGNPEKILPTMKRIKELSGLTPSLHWYGWNNQRSDTDYPEYNVDAVAAERLTKAVASFHQEGIRILPYINGRLWNIDTPAWRERNAAQYACRSADAVPGESYSFYLEPYKERPFVTMCPATKFWRDTIQNKCQDLLEWGMDGAYIDQVSSSFPRRCHAKEHGHNLNGNYFAKGYQQMMRDIRGKLRQRFPEAAFTSESVIECYIGSFDLFLAYNGSCSPIFVFGEGSQSVPMFSYVYHGYIPLYGTGTGINQQTHFFQGQAMDLANGVIPSLQAYYAEDIGHYNAEEQFFLKSCNLYSQHKAFFRDATRLPAPEIQVATTPVTDCGVTQQLPAVQGTTWQNGQDTRILLVNFSPETQPVTVNKTKSLVLPPYSLQLI